MKIYTRKGDGGQTSLYGGAKTSKNALQVECYGTVDEANSVLGLAAGLVDTSKVKEIIAILQKELFTLGAELASTSQGASKLPYLLGAPDINRLEEWIDQLTAQYPAQQGFVLPGGTPGTGVLDLARAVVRRAERVAVGMAQQQPVRDEVLQYLNRLSDLLFVMARFEAYQVLVGKVRDQVLAELAKGVQTKKGVEEMELALAKRIMAAAEKKAEEIGVPMVIAVVDSGGNLVAMERQDEALMVSLDIARNKAYTAVALKMSTEQVAPLVQPGQPLYGLEQTNGGRLVVFGGGIPLKKGGRIIGAIGVSGGSVEEDIVVANAGVEVVERG